MTVLSEKLTQSESAPNKNTDKNDINKINNRSKISQEQTRELMKNEKTSPTSNFDNANSDYDATNNDNENPG